MSKLDEEEKVKATLSPRGSGTERVVEDLAALFPEAIILRMDRDNVSDIESYEQILRKMRSGEADILVGTQMIAKGHDIPSVTLVGIVDADVGLHLPDFRSNERIYQLLVQASGRSGRGERPGRVIIQTRQPEHPVLLAVALNRQKAFMRYEMEYRKSLHYPPWGRLLRVIVSSPSERDCERVVLQTAQQVNAYIEGIRVQASSKTSGELNLWLLGPTRAPHERLKGRYRQHFFVKSNSASALSAIARALVPEKARLCKGKDVRILIDVDPVQML